MFYLLLLGDLQGLTCFWDERPCWRVPPSSAEFCLFLGSRGRGQDSFHAPAVEPKFYTKYLVVIGVDLGKINDVGNDIFRTQRC